MRRARRQATKLLALALLLACGCGKKGPPVPPQPRGPLPPRLVEARQIGSSAVVSFEVPRARGGKPAQLPVRAELIRIDYAPGLEAPADPDAFRRRGELVGTLEGDPLEQGTVRRLADESVEQLAEAGVGRRLRYGIRVRDLKRRSSPLVVAEDLVLLPSVSGPRNLNAEPTADGIRLTWEPPTPEGQYRYNVYRSAPQGPEPLTPLNPAALQAPAFLDSEQVPGERYAYVVRTVLAEGRPYREGESSETLVVLSIDRFAPEPPTGLVAVQEGPAVRLFWNPSGERDLAGYRVLRRVTGGAFERVGPDLVGKPNYLDTEIEAGQHLAYRITAVDRADPPNESEPSITVDLVVLEEPTAPGELEP
jgi:hypothetical protein